MFPTLLIAQNGNIYENSVAAIYENKLGTNWGKLGKTLKYWEKPGKTEKNWVKLGKLLVGFLSMITLHRKHF